ncbi:Protein IQ-DOMAIN 14, partial [Cucurbita argyrosperma subsp. sororia]
MRKAGKWVVNFLVGKKEKIQKKNKKKIVGSSSSSSFSDSENLKLRLSFRKTSSTNSRLLLTHKLSKSVDSIDTIDVFKPGAMKKKPPSSVQNAAATTIQSAYRSYLARKALYALRALVKIQALVRGYLVRKQTATTLKSLQALMAIQVRARANRIQLLEEDDKLLERRRHEHLPNTNLEKEMLNMNLDETRRSYKSKSGYISRSQVEQIKNGPNACSCRRNLSIPTRQHQHKNLSISIEPNISEYYVLMSKPTANRTLCSMDPPRHSDFVPDEYPCYPNYMAKTESSRAKLRSQSEPRQRPGSSAWPKCKQAENALQNMEHNGYESHSHTWFMKLYQLTKSSKNSDGDSTSSKFSCPDEPRRH